MIKDKKIKVNVGGVYYETTNTTLLSINGNKSYFSAFLSNLERDKKNVIDNEEYEIFIDRNGMLFQYILDYLRTGSTVTVPNKIHIIKGLMIEADYYMLDNLSLLLTKKLEAEQANNLNMNMNMMYIQNMSGENRTNGKYRKTDEYSNSSYNSSIYFDQNIMNTCKNEQSHQAIKSSEFNSNKLNYKFSLNEDF
ncbi:hypothetical protein FG386_002754 [Cryptosporidium ryanae]|uniref:uncharacterized protein n=1 Tax=Cryptosporidium ryanae TaxID=515981 RepID=UPI00351A8121|nr:hypothetical protein FG386_002754 [Cryptosporidium ryanae]